MPITNLVMGPPVFAPLLFGTSAYLGFHRVVPTTRRRPRLEEACAIEAAMALRKPDFRDDIRVGRFQKHCVSLSPQWAQFDLGAEAWYSHYKDNFKYQSAVVARTAHARTHLCCVGVGKKQAGCQYSSASRGRHGQW